MIPAHLLPKIRPSVEFVGTWRDAEVVVGGGDTPVSLVALEHAVDGWQPGDVVVNLGTGAQVIDPRTGPPTGSGWSDVHVYEGVLGDHYSMVAAQNAGLALSWAQKQLGINWDELSAICQQAPPGAGGVLFSPFVAPERGALSPDALGTWMDLGGDGQPSAHRPWRHVRQPRHRHSWFDAPGSCSTWTRAGCSCWVVAHASPWVRQLLADVLGRPVNHLPMRSVSAAGAVILAGGPTPRDARPASATAEPNEPSRARGRLSALAR